MIPHGTESNLNGNTTSQKVPGYVVEHLAADSALTYAVAGGNGLRHEAATVPLAAISFGPFPNEPTCPGSETSLVPPVYRKARLMPNLRSQFLLQRRRRRCLDRALSLQKSAIELRDLVVELRELANLVRVAEERRQNLRSRPLTAACKAARIFRMVRGPPGPRLVRVVMNRRSTLRIGRYRRTTCATNWQQRNFLAANNEGNACLKFLLPTSRLMK